MNRKVIIIAAVVSAVALFFGVAAAQEKTDKLPDVVARVNDDKISAAQYKQEITRLMVTASRGGRKMGPQDRDQIEAKALDNLIERELLLEAAEKNDIAAPKEEVDAEMDKIKSRFPSEEAFRQKLEEMGVTPESVREDIRAGLTINRFIEEEMAARAEVSDEDVKVFYMANPQYFTKPEQVHARHILIKTGEKADEAAKKKAHEQAVRLQEKAASGEDFAALAKEHSEGPSKSRGGDLGFFGRGQMVKPFEEAAFSLEPGQVSEIVETRFGYHVIKVEEKKPETKLTLKESTDRIRKHLKTRAVQENIKEFLAEARQEADIEIMLPQKKAASE